MQTPNTSRWIIGRVGDPTQGAGIGHVDFMLFVSFLVALGKTSKFITAGCSQNAAAFKSNV